MAIIVTQSNIAEIKRSPKPVIIDVFAEWCGPCQHMAPIFEEISKELGEQFTFAKLNVDDAREISIEFGVTSVPTFIFMRDGQVVAKETGYMDKEDLIEKIMTYLS